MEKKMNPKLYSNVLQIIIIVLLVILIAIGGMLLFKNNKKENPENSNSNVTENNNNANADTILSISIENEMIKKLYNDLFPNYYDCSQKWFYHSSNQLLGSDIPYSTKMAIVAKNWVADNSKNIPSDVVVSNYGDDYQIPEYRIKEKYIQLFGPSYPENDENKNSGDSCPGMTFSNGSYKIYKACGDTCLSPFSSFLIKAEKNETLDEYYIYDKMFSLKFDGTGKADLYKDVNKTILVKSNVSETISFRDLDNSTIQQLDTYKYTFKTNSDGTYYFYKVEKVQ